MAGGSIKNMFPNLGHCNKLIIIYSCGIVNVRNTNDRRPTKNSESSIILTYFSSYET